ncbi:MAG: alpha/beta hydrolase [Candidatus Dormibacteraeota bacterium]|nr:alpha/beta hydrolase [Candidatus Dormibacteraeota bacterium]
MGRLARQEVRLDGRILSWQDAGQGEPVVVLEAGHGDAAQAWSGVVPLVAAGTRVIAYDRAGLGASDADPALPTVDRRLTDLAALIEHARAAPCVLAGHSWGGILAWALACRRPDLVAGLVLVDPADLDMLNSLPGWVRSLSSAPGEDSPAASGVSGRRRRPASPPRPPRDGTWSSPIPATPSRDGDPTWSAI